MSMFGGRAFDGLRRGILRQMLIRRRAITWNAKDLVKYAVVMMISACCCSLGVLFLTFPFQRSLQRRIPCLVLGRDVDGHRRLLRRRGRLDVQLLGYVLPVLGRYFESVVEVYYVSVGFCR